VKHSLCDAHLITCSVGLKHVVVRHTAVKVCIISYKKIHMTEISFSFTVSNVESSGTHRIQE
jgi:hypothetical protein